MPEPTSLDVPDFDAFYRATHRGVAPFPWQTRLAAEVDSIGWREEIGVPTGLGKTACLDIAVWALARQAHRPPRERTAPTRTWYVVNRRLLVDAAFEHGRCLAKWLAQPASLRDDWPDAVQLDEHVDVLGRVGVALKSIAALGSELGPLHITRLRGGADLGQRAPDPSMPTLVFVTVPMFASRWLFRGFGSSPSMRPVDAALAGVDSLVLLDEAHLARPLLRLTEPLAACDLGDPTLVVPASRALPRFVGMTATGEGGPDRFDLDATDRAHPEIRKRLGAAKTTALTTTTGKLLVEDLAKAAVAKLGEPGQDPAPISCLVFANTPAVARAVFDRLTTMLGTRIDVERPVLLTGRMREREAEQARAELSGVAASRDRSRAFQRSLVVVATQTLEVGADLDVDHLVTETAGVRSLVQRFGRLNRLGDTASATATVVHPADLEERPVYGAEPAAVWRRLEEAVERGDDSLGPERIAEILGEPDDQPDDPPELLPHHLWDWAKTSLPGRRPLVEPEVFYEEADDRVHVSVIWRAYIPEVPADDSGRGSSAAGAPERSEDWRQLVPPIVGDEAVDLPRWELQAVLRQRQVTEVMRVRPDGKAVETVPLDALRPGDRVVLRSSLGMYDKAGWAPESRTAVADLSFLRSGLVLHPEVLRARFAVPSEKEDGAEPAGDEGAVDPSSWSRLVRAVRQLRQPPGDGDDLAEADERSAGALDTIREVLDGLGPPDWLADAEVVEWHDWWDDMKKVVDRHGVDGLTWLPDGSPFVERPKVRKRWGWVGIRSEPFEDLSFVDVDPTSAELSEHLCSVGRTARRIAECIGLPPDLATLVQKAGAAHDLGKQEPRFQRWLDPDPDPEAPERTLAKSATPWEQREATRIRSGWPRGGRHELLSARIMAGVLDNDGPDRDLLLHLVISHHGHGRPTVGVAEDREPTWFLAEVDGWEPFKVPGDLSQPDWEQPGRFRRMCERYGYWGLALLEAIVRQADHAASAAIVDGVDSKQTPRHEIPEVA